MKQNTLKKLIGGLGFATFVVLTGCESTPPPPVPDLTFDYLQKINLAVENIDVVEELNPNITGTLNDTDKVSFSDDLLPMPLNMYIKRWATDRFHADGTPGHTAKITLHEASLTRTELPIEKGMKGIFNKQPSEQFDGKVKMTLEILDKMGRTVASAETESAHFKTIMEDDTLNQRRHAMFGLTSDLLKDLDTEMAKQISSHLSRYASTVPPAFN